MFYSFQPEMLPAFMPDTLGFPCTDVGDGWLIFDLPEADMGCQADRCGQQPTSGTQSISFYCDDLANTVGALRSRGVEFTDAISDWDYGLVIHFEMPGDFQVALYQPRYEKN